MRIEGRTALVVGGAGGIGSAICRTLHEAGAQVHATAIDPAERDSAGPRLPEAVLHLLDVTDDIAVRRLAEGFGPLDILVNCAGITRRGDEAFGEDAFGSVMDINVHGTMRAARAFHPALAVRKGCVINIASVMSFRGSGTAPGYAASKGAVMQLTRSLAIAWARDGIRVNAVAPGFIVTPMTDQHIDPDYRARVSDRTPMGRWGRPDEIADAVLFLASDRASFITGAIVPVDGGYLAA